MSNRKIADGRASGIARLALGCLLSVSLGGCFDGGGSSKSSGSTGGTGNPPDPPTSNSAPTISGSPTTSAKVGQAYSFQPTARDADGDSLTFTISSKPAWAAFDAKTGRLSGTPSSSYTGTFANIQISVSDGKANASLAKFAISVASGQLGSATLSWQPPTENTDGTALTNLAGYYVRYGKSPGGLSTEVKIANPGLTTYVVSDLSPATWYFQVSAYNSTGVESAPSATASKTIT